MWSRKKRKKEGKDSSNPAPPGKQMDESRPSSPSALSKSDRPANSKHVLPTPPSQPPQPHPKNNNLPIPAKPLANPNLKPSLTVPLPSAPLSANILDSPQGSVHDSSNPASGGPGILGPVPATLSADSNESANPVATQHLQKVIEAQRTQIALLSQITQQLKQSQHTPRLQTNQVPVLSPAPQDTLSPIVQQQAGLVSHTNTFDYGNQSNKVLEQVAAEQLEREYYQDGWQ